MIKEIKKPKINFKIFIHDNVTFYYDEENNEYFFKTEVGSKYYFNLKGNYHRIGRPAIECYYGKKEWVENGKLHRLDGHAYINGKYKEFWINDIFYFGQEFAEKTSHLICKYCQQFCKQECFYGY